MNVTPTAIAGVMVVHTTPFADHRGIFQRVFCDKELESTISGRHISQINHSRTTRVGAVRGMHFQRAPHAEIKLVRCLRGKVWDVAIDLRADSPTFLQWHAEELSFDNGRMLVVPEGCAHGFQVIEPESELLYLHTASYEPSAEGGIRHDDPALRITWPLPIAEVSQRDQLHPLITPQFRGIPV
ncbi:dTDP-4-dehydrorhamnose 3,5-epimerase [Paraburkholderia sp. HC6.4b]|uniref:dTDP-4-dehydrorhamnose 3,5-epimerase family protein n=1 Tax=unclassified Paraburkholderia TaxID=2615204 RepID=UPI00160883E7|nr:MULTISPECIES: dTDP-4-dehydrorhamnose 3,5-epimerase family protein [unclassified Paraburkholderia]MBB5408224.1 dTDP-4-dehydrorhamnose 3,5-epimerase [Paraburkholderia sp. HC6.4b]MBB5453215.1 dTDP-4-dehydrorhamnose 3,5-epimerase [Paraburkholderia sp. Kb1A]